MTETSDQTSGAMHRRRITIEGDRYLVFYTFGGEQTPPAPDAASDAVSRAEVNAEQIATEESHV